MELKTTMREYKASNCSIKFNKDLTEVSAYSYGWWEFITTDKVGNVFYNDVSYSRSTSGHQGSATSIMARLGLSIDFTLYRTNNTLKGYERYSNKSLTIKDALNDEISKNRWDILGLVAKIKTKGSWKKTNIERKASISKMLFRIKDLRNIRDNYLDKKRIPRKKRSIEKLEIDIFSSWDYKNKKEIYIITKSDQKNINLLKSYCLSNNGKLNIVLYKDILSTLKNDNIPSSIDKIKELLGFKATTCIKSILVYEFSNDLNNMIPEIDSKEYTQLLKRLKTIDITKDNLTTLDLDKIHTYLTNKLNRKLYVPSEPIAFNLSEKLLKLENTPKLRLIKSDRELKAEGRKQSHCIGGADYIKKCLQGYQALNYKNYTFFLSPKNDIIQTNGSHNTTTPDNIENELKKLIQKAA